MERKYKSQKKTILVLAVLCVLFIGLICFLQVRIKNVKADVTAEMEQKVAALAEERDALQAEFEESGIEDKAKELKSEKKDLEKEKKALLKALEEAEEAAEEDTEG